MPADRGRSSRQNDTSECAASYVLALPWTSNANMLRAPAPVDPSSEAPPEGAPSNAHPIFIEQESHPHQQTRQSKKKPENHIPRPPNAFILFRSSFIRNRHVSDEVETNHSTLSKIIGLTWQKLSEAERQEWHAKARIAQEEHRRQFPQYCFRPVHSKVRGAVAERKKHREVGRKDQKRCDKIAELLVGGKKGQELKVAIQEFDKHHVPEIVTRFETPITANSFTSSKNERRSLSPVPLRKKSSATSRRASKVSSAPPPSASLGITSPQDTLHSMPLIPSPSPHSFDSLDQTPSFELPSFNFTITQPSPLPFIENHYMGDVHNPSIHAFDPHALQDTSSLCPTAQYSPCTDDSWPRQGSPLSNSTSSMPSTPAQICVPFPEPYNSSAFHMDNNAASTSNYEAIGNPYCDFSQYPSFPQISEPSYEISRKGSEHLTSGLDGHFHMHSEGVNSPQLQAPQDHDFLSFMQMNSLPTNGYSL